MHLSARQANFKLQVLLARNRDVHTFAAALHMSATILPETHVSKIFEVAKLHTFCSAT